MKFVFMLIALSSFCAVAEGIVSGESALIEWKSGGNLQYQVNISGKSAEVLFEKLDVPAVELKDQHSGSPYGQIKNGGDINCSQTYGNYSCWMIVNKTGQVIK